MAEEREESLEALRFDRICRTAHSEAFLLSDSDDPIGRVDLHYGASIVHAVLVLERDLEDEVVRELVERIDDELVWTADRPRDDFMVTVYRGTEIALFSDVEEDDDENEDAEREP